MALVAAAAHAQTTSVDIRIVERTGQTQVLYSAGASPDATLDFAVQMRVNGGGVLGGFGFDLILAGEPETSGVLALELTSNVDHTYAGLPPVLNAAVGRGGLAYTYTYLAAINNAFNGVINASSGQFTHNPANSEIGLITGSAASAQLFQTPGVDPNQEGNPSTWSGYGTGAAAPVGATAGVPASVGPVYLAQGQYVDVYRFRYTVTSLSTRSLLLTLGNLRLQTASQFVVSHGWGLNNTTWVAPVNSTPLTVPIVLAPQGACCDGATGACATGAEFACAAGAWTAGGACQPNPCPQPGACCAPAGACTVVMLPGCAAGSVWTAGGACVPNVCPQPGMCCDASGACAAGVQSACAAGSVWTAGGACEPNVCPQPGACCDGAGACTMRLQSACGAGSTWTAAGACEPNGCPQPGTCCDGAGLCTMRLQSACGAGSTWTAGGACEPSPCPAAGACCRGSTCQLASEASCTGQFSRFAGSGLACNAQGNVTQPCCIADFNGDGLSVQDIFDFLNMWLAGDARADVGGDGISVQDIFDFLNAWLAGC